MVNSEATVEQRTNANAEFAQLHAGSRNDLFFLSDSDDPCMQIVATLFNGSNYASWSMSVRMALAAKQKLGFIDGICPQPAAGTGLYECWLKCDSMVRCWIRHSIASDLRENYVYFASAKALWEELREQYGEVNAPLIYQLKCDLNSTVQGNLSVSQYFGKLKKLWNQLAQIDALPECTCGAAASCSCLLLKRIYEREDRDRLIQFLIGLNESYEVFKGNLLLQDPLPTVNKAYRNILQLERQKHVAALLQQPVEASAMAVNKNNASSSNSPFKKDQKDYKGARFERKCTYCGKNGHLRETCYQLNGYPDWLPEQRKKQGRAQGNFSGNVAQKACPSSSTEVKADQAMVNAICKEVMKMMKDTKATSDVGALSFSG